MEGKGPVLFPIDTHPLPSSPSVASREPRLKWDTPEVASRQFWGVWIQAAGVLRDGMCKFSS